jgi:hypothetical protein
LTRSFNERVVGSGHENAVFARFLDAIAQRQPEIEHQRLFGFAVRLGAVVDPAMAGIDDDQRARIGRPGWLRRSVSRRRDGDNRHDGGIGFAD